MSASATANTAEAAAPKVEVPLIMIVSSPSVISSCFTVSPVRAVPAAAPVAWAGMVTVYVPLFW